MPYDDERAGLAAIQAIADSTEFEEFRARLQPPSQDAVLCLPPFRPSPSGRSRTHMVAIDGSQVYDNFPGRLPDTHAGVVSLGIVVINLRSLSSLRRLPASGAVNPRELRETEHGQSLGALLPGTNATTIDGLGPREWFRLSVNETLNKGSLWWRNFCRNPLSHTRSRPQNPPLP